MKSIALYTLFFLSGVAGLGYEILWTRMLAVSLGHEIVSVFAVVSAFFSGLALGAWALDGLVSRSEVPGKWYTLLEAVIGLWALALVWIAPELTTTVSQWIGAAPSALHHWAISFLYPFFMLLPATAAMGGTLPAMDRLFEQLRNQRRAVAGLYSINTFGAVAGTLLVTFLVLPTLGVNQTSLLLASVNFIGAAGTMLLASGKHKMPRSATEPESPWMKNPKSYWILFITGIAGIGFEVLMVRVLSQTLQNTVFSFAAILAVFLFGTAAGAGVYQKARPARHTEGTLSFLLLSTAVFCLASIFMLRYVYPLFQSFQQAFGSGFRGAIAAELSISLLFFLLPTASMGATFSHLAQSLKGRENGVGRALCLNTLGGAAAPVLFGVLLLPTLGIKHSLLAIPIVYLFCLPRLRAAYAGGGALLAVIALFMILDSHSYQLVSLAEGDTVEHHREGVRASVSIVKDTRNHLHLKVNNHYQMGGTSSVFSDRRQAYLPLLLHPSPERALFLGLGAGGTFAAAADFPDLQADGVELIPEVIDLMGYFEKATSKFDAYENLRIVNADARRYVTAVDRTYDVVVADLFHPARDGAGSLYTLEHFRAARNLLTPEGLFCQWLPLYQLDLEMFKVITRTFLEVFPEGQAYLAHYSIDQPIVGLVGGRQRLRFPENWYRRRLQGKSLLHRRMSGFGYDSVYSLLGTFLAGGERLQRWVEASPLNTDAHPVVLFQAPRFVYENPEPAHARLTTLLAAFSPADPESVLAPVVTEEDHMARSRLSNYWSARDSFLKLGMRVEHSKDVTRLYESTSGPLLEVVRKSFDFSAAYFPLISIAYELYPHDRDASYRLLRDLERANPMRGEAGILRQRLFVKD